MPQILVGGDNPDAYSICDAIEQKASDHSLPVVFCTTPHEVLSALARGGAAAVVLNFEQAGLTNFELAYRIRETENSGAIPVLLPEVDALGDVTGALGKLIGIFAFPVQPDDVAALACKLIATARQAPPPRPIAKAPPAPLPPTEKQPPAERPSPPEVRRTHAGRPEHASPTAAVSREARETRVADPVETPLRSRRVRHRSWDAVHTPRSRRSRSPAAAEPPEKNSPAQESRPDPEAAQGGERKRLDPKLLRLGLVLVVVALPVFAFYGYQAYRSAMEDRAVSSPTGPLVDVVCTACGVRESRPVDNIHEVRCRKCGKPMGFTFRCHDCKAEFPYMPPAEVKTLKGHKPKAECPKCHSWNVQPIPAEPARTATPGAKPAEPAKAPKPGAKPAEPAKAAAPKQSPKPAEPAEE